MTKKALEKLNEKQMTYCRALSALVVRARENGLKAEFEKKSGKLRGYLECLWHMDILKQSEVRVLYLYFMQGK